MCEKLLANTVIERYEVELARRHGRDRRAHHRAMNRACGRPMIRPVGADAGGPERGELRANVKLVISGGQNEPRDAIAGTAWALLAHPEALARCGGPGELGAGLRRIRPPDRPHRHVAAPGRAPRHGAGRHLRARGPGLPDVRLGRARRGPFHRPDRYDILRDTGPALTFGAGPHFCAGAAAARCLITEVALPMLFERLGRAGTGRPGALSRLGLPRPAAVPVRWPDWRHARKGASRFLNAGSQWPWPHRRPRSFGLRPRNHNIL
jgi:hypothetical protein